jgi:hypothetical protein
MTAEIKERLSLSKQASNVKVDMERFNLKKLKDVEVKEQYQVKVSASGNLDDNV